MADVKECISSQDEAASGSQKPEVPLSLRWDDIMKHT